MEVEFTVKIKEERNPPVFNKQLGKGVLQIQKVKINTAGISDARIASGLLEIAEEMKKHWIEVTYKKI